MTGLIYNDVAFKMYYCKEIRQCYVIEWEDVCDRTLRRYDADKA